MNFFPDSIPEGQISDSHTMYSKTSIQNFYLGVFCSEIITPGLISGNVLFFLKLKKSRIISAGGCNAWDYLRF